MVDADDQSMMNREEDPYESDDSENDDNSIMQDFIAGPGEELETEGFQDSDSGD